MSTGDRIMDYSITYTHNHSGCKHNCLNYCPICDIVYCSSCGKEWVAKLSWFFPYEVADVTYNTNGTIKYHTHE
jgi:hypothetical protein